MKSHALKALGASLLLVFLCLFLLLTDPVLVLAESTSSQAQKTQRHYPTLKLPDKSSKNSEMGSGASSGSDLKKILQNSESPPDGAQSGATTQAESETDSDYDSESGAESNSENATETGDVAASENVPLHSVYLGIDGIKSFFELKKTVSTLQESLPQGSVFKKAKVLRGKATYLLISVLGLEEVRSLVSGMKLETGRLALIGTTQDTVLVEIRK